MIRRRNKHADLMKHKKVLKKRYLFHLGDKEYGGSLKRMEDDLKTDAPHRKRIRNRGFEYWHQTSLSGRRGYAKSATNRAIRARYRSSLRNLAPEDVKALKGGEYGKEYDYVWTVW